MLQGVYTHVALPLPTTTAPKAMAYRGETTAGCPVGALRAFACRRQLSAFTGPLSAQEGWKGLGTGLNWLCYPGWFR